MIAKHALLIGIDAYPRIAPLQGCVNDVTLLRGVLEEAFGFPPDRVTMLTNGAATRTGILDALDTLIDRIGAGDIVVIHYAGHGSLMTDREGDEPSGYDSTIMPFDSEGWQGDNRDITDDEIHLRLQRLAERTSNTTLIFDCCHSGTIARDAFGATARSMPADTRPVSELPPSPIPQSMRSRAGEDGRSGWLPLSASYVLVAGCRDEEVAFEYRPPEAGGKVKHGALTFFLSRELRQATPGTTWRELFERAATLVTAANPAQHPQLEGSIDRAVFDVADITPMQYARITERRGDVVTLAWGAAMGATIGSRYDVFAQTVRNAAAATPLGTIEINDVRATSSDARIIAETSSGAIEVNARALQSRHAYGRMRAGVQVVAADDVTAVAALRKRIEESALLELVEDEMASARVHLLDATSCWAVVRADGRLLLPHAPLDDSDRIIRALENTARYTLALSLENADTSSALRNRFDVELLRKNDAGEWVIAQPETGGAIVFHEGDIVDIRVISRHDQPAFVNVLDFGVQSSISLVYPARGASEQLIPGGSFSVSRGRGLRLQFPELPDTGDGVVTEGVEVVKLIVTSSAADFSWLRQQDVRSVPHDASASPLISLWRAATLGGGTRELMLEPDSDEDWTTVTRPFVLRRR